MDKFVSQTDETRIELLKKFSEYDRTLEGDCPSEFVLGGKTPKILKKYHYSDYINQHDASSDEIVFRLLDFVCDNFGHDGSGGMSTDVHITKLIKFSERNNGMSNCRSLAILLASLLRLNKIKARHITCLPYEDPFDDCHVVVDCLLPSGRRIMLDPSWRLYLKDKSGEYVSLPRLRELLLADEPIFENPGAGHNKEGFDKQYYRDYMIKNTMRFARCTLSKDGVDRQNKGSGYVTLIPKGYPTGQFPENRKADFVYNDLAFWRM